MLPDIEEMVVKELSGLCASCAHYEGCVYRKNATRIVIQCEVFESAGVATARDPGAAIGLKGLCLNCSRNSFCHLPKEASGVWQCEEYE